MVACAAPLCSENFNAVQSLRWPALATWELQNERSFADPTFIGYSHLNLKKLIIEDVNERLYRQR